MERGDGRREVGRKEGRRNGAESSIIEGNLAAAAERTMASFHPASVTDFLVDLITLRFCWRSEILPAGEAFCSLPSR